MERGSVGKPASEMLVQIGRRRPALAEPPEAAAGATRARVYIETYGCQMNVADSDLLLGVLADAGYGRAERPEDAQVLVLNTCAVREKAEEKVLARANELASIKRRRSGAVLAVVGCMAEHLKGKVVGRSPLRRRSRRRSMSGSTAARCTRACGERSAETACPASSPSSAAATSSVPS